MVVDQEIGFVLYDVKCSSNTSTDTISNCVIRKNWERSRQELETQCRASPAPCNRARPSPALAPSLLSSTSEAIL